MLIPWWEPNVEFLFQDLSSLTSNAVSSVTAGAGLFLLADSVVALRTASQHCGSETDYLSSLPYSEYYYPIYEIKDCLLTSVSLTVSSFRLNILSCEICVSPLHNLCFSGSLWSCQSECLEPDRNKQKPVVRRGLSADCVVWGMCYIKSKEEIKKDSRESVPPLSFLSQTFQPQWV